MPIREYVADDSSASCPYCSAGFELLEGIHAEAIEKCPECGAPIHRVLSAPRIGRSESGLHDRAKSAGFTTYKKTGTGEYEKKY